MDALQQKDVGTSAEEMAEIEPASPALLKELYDLALLMGVDKIPISDDVWLDIGENLKVRLSQDGSVYLQFSAGHPSYTTASAYSKSDQRPICGGCKFTSEWGIRPDGTFINGHEKIDSWSISTISLVRTKYDRHPTRSELLNSPPAAENIRAIIQRLQEYRTKVIRHETISAVETALG